MHCDLQPLLNELSARADERYRRFNESLTPGTENRSIGVRMPVLRAMARTILRKDPEGFLDASLTSDVHELRLLHAIVLAQYKCSFETRLMRLAAFVPTIDNWAVCDTLCNDLKPLPEHLDDLLGFLRRCLSSGREFEVRFGYVMLMLYYHDDDRINETLRLYADFRHEGYYAQMGAAWGLSMLFVFQREQTLHFLQTDALDRFTHNTAIRKCVESRQITDSDKRLLRTLRR